MKHVLALLICFMSLSALTQSNRAPQQQATSTVTPRNTSPEVVETTEAQPQIQRSTMRATVDPLLMRAYTALGKNQFTLARETYSQVLANNPTQRDALLGMAYTHQALGNSEQALSTLRRLVELYPRDSDGLSALYLIGGGDLIAEETRFKQLLDRSENPAALHYALGVLYFDQSRFGEAERSFSRAAALSPNQPDYAYNLALALDQLGRGREAARQYVQALNLANQTSAVFSRDLARARLKILTATAP